MFIKYAYAVEKKKIIWSLLAAGKLNNLIVARV